MKKLWIGIIGIVVVALVILLVVMQMRNKPVIKIGVITPLTGPAAKYGIATKNGLELAAEEIEKTTKKELLLIYEDSKMDPKEAVNALRKLMVDKVKVVIGATTSSEFLAMAPIAEENEIILFTPSASTPKISQAGDYIFRNCYSDIFEATKMADYIFTHTSYRKIAVLYINNDYGVGMKNTFKIFFEKKGGNIILEEAYDPQERDFKTYLLKIKENKPDGIYLVGYAEMGYILRQAKEMGIYYPIFSCIMFEDPDIIKIAQEAAEGVVYTYPSYNPMSEKDIIKEFVEKYRKKYNEIPNIYAATAYDALKILYMAIEIAGYSPEKIKEKLYSIRDYPGVTGSTSFDANGDVIKPVGIKKVENGEFKWIFYEY
jgi:branched-chain amino acid transport system substrate-binding protein